MTSGAGNINFFAFEDLSSVDTGAAAKTPPSQSHSGLGNRLGGELVRSALGRSGAQIGKDPSPMTPRGDSTFNHSKTLNGGLSPSSGIFGRGKANNVVSVAPLERDAVPAKGSLASKNTNPLSPGHEPQGIFLGLLLNDQAWPSAQDLQFVRDHRWCFQGAEELASQSNGYCCFIRCLLDLQRNVQLEEEGDALDSRLKHACKSFVCANCIGGSMGDMYQLLTHFLSNSLLFVEWDRYLKGAFENPRSNTEAFLVPHLEQVWNRFLRFRVVLEEVFEVLNSRYVWHHRLPKVSDLLREHMRRRCFSSESIKRNELFAQEKTSNDTVKKIKYHFGFV